MHIFTLENLAYILPGDWIVLTVIVVLIVLFFKYRVPAVNTKICKKRDTDDCNVFRLSCQTLLITKLDNLNTLMISKIDGLDEKFTSKIEDVKDLIRRNGG